MDISPDFEYSFHSDLLFVCGNPCIHGVVAFTMNCKGKSTMLQTWRSLHIISRFRWVCTVAIFTHHKYVFPASI